MRKKVTILTIGLLVFLPFLLPVLFNYHRFLNVLSSDRSIIEFMVNNFLRPIYSSFLVLFVALVFWVIASLIFRVYWMLPTKTNTVLPSRLDSNWSSRLVIVIINSFLLFFVISGLVSFAFLGVPGHSQLVVNLLILVGLILEGLILTLCFWPASERLPSVSARDVFLDRLSKYLPSVLVGLGVVAYLIF